LISPRIATLSNKIARERISVLLMMVCGNAATRMETFIVKGGVFAYGSYTEIDELFDQQTTETDAANAKRFCIGCSSWCMSMRPTRPSGSLASSVARAPASRSQDSG
jgi:hypothetical protein